uniref:Ribosomal protein S10 n=1 Tax=Melosira undulata TaxID=2133757 RepID=A0A3G1PWG3_9STRA|nr:ribosomal protein S10 [Melosira undulata]AVR57571.1 ribosomal protein S10 [Melosira undulata]
MLFLIKIFSKNIKSIFRFLKLLKICIFLKFINLHVLQTQYKLKKLKKFTILKSPHVNKKSKEKFYFIKFEYFLILNVVFGKKCLYILKLLQIKLSADLQITIKITFLKNKKVIKNYKNQHLKLLDLLGENFFNCLNSSIGRAKD